MSQEPKGLDLARKRLEQCIEAESYNRAEALIDLQFRCGDQWDEQSKQSRALDGRPMLTINKLQTFLHQVLNDQRQNKPGIKIHPVDDGADVETAKIIQGMIRHIEYASNADTAYDTAIEGATTNGFGYFAIKTDYCDAESFDQDIKFQRIANPFSVYLDPASQELDGSDARFAFVIENMAREEFEIAYPDAEANDKSLLRGIGDGQVGWLDNDFVRVADYYFIKETQETLVRLNDGRSVWKSELEKTLTQDDLMRGVAIVKERKSVRRKVMWQKITSVDVLEEREIPCEWIPVFPVYGDVVNINGKVIRSGLIRYARDPQRMYNFWMTAATEEVAMRNKTPYIAAEGQLEGHEAQWRQANNRSFPVLQYKPVTVNGTMAPAPQRQPMADVPVGVLQMAMHANDNIKAATGLFDSSLGARGNATSGVQEASQQRQGQISTFHYTDNLTITIRHAARCILSMLKIYDTERVVKILGEDDSITTATINKQATPEDEQNEESKVIDGVLHNLSAGKYDVTVSVGPSYSTLRQESSAAMIEAVRAYPPLMQIAGDLVVKSQDWPGADDLAERLKRSIDPKLLGEEEAVNELPPEAQQAMQQMQQHIQELSGALQEHESGMAKAKLEAVTKVHIAELNNESKQDVEELKGMIQLVLQQIQPPAQLVNEVSQDIMENELEKNPMAQYQQPEQYEQQQPNQMEQE